MARRTTATTRMLDFDAPFAVASRLAAASEALAGAHDVPADVREVVGRLAHELATLERERWPAIDPYLFAELLQAAVASERALGLEDAHERVAELELQLEAMRDVFHDLAHGAPVRDDRPASDVARWLRDTLGASSADLERLLGPSARTWERWLSVRDRAEPRGDDELRLRMAARIVNQLRHGLTARGVLRWLELPHPGLDGRAPRELLAEPHEAGRLVALAAQTRVSDAA